VSTVYSTWCSCAPGLEKLLAAELQGLGLKPKEIEPGGMSAGMTPAQLYAANLHCSVASRITVRLGKFHASEFWELEKRAERLAWHAWLPKGSEVAFRVTSRKSKLYHNDGIAERLGALVAAKVPGVSVAAPAADDEEGRDIAATDPRPPTLDARRPTHTQLFLVRIINDEVTVSIDASGDLLYRRGWRHETAKAPIRETLAAAMLTASGWMPGRNLHDPFCGSGTVVIEAARRARNIPAGRDRDFAFERWPTFDAGAWREVRARAESAVRPLPGGTLLGTDRDPGAIRAALANSRRAGVEDDVQFAEADIRDLPPQDGTAIVTNPPYGVRVGEPGDMAPLYSALGRLTKGAGTTLTFLSPDHALTQATRVATKTAWKSLNGGIGVECCISAPPLP
jgi:putative N6-adenine-specific DNA methylase